MNRQQFFMLSLVFQLIFTLLQNDAAGTMFFLPFALIVCHYRLNNIGMSGWWVFSLIVPILNIYTSFILTFAPTGFKRASHENFNKPDIWYYIGFTIMSIIMLLILAIIIAAVVENY